MQLTTDGLKSYLEAIEGAFGMNVDYAMLIKNYGADPRDGAVRYSPVECTGRAKNNVTGNPDIKHVSTSYVDARI